MRVIKFDGKEFRITGQQRRSLLNRFNIVNARKVVEGWRIDIPCVMCKRVKCGDCAFSDYGCGGLLGKAGSPSLCRASYSHAIIWGGFDDVQVRMGMENIYQLLLDAKLAIFPKVRRLK